MCGRVRCVYSILGFTAVHAVKQNMAVSGSLNIVTLLAFIKHCESSTVYDSSTGEDRQLVFYCFPLRSFFKAVGPVLNAE